MAVRPVEYFEGIGRCLSSAQLGRGKKLSGSSTEKFGSDWSDVGIRPTHVASVVGIIDWRNYFLLYLCSNYYLRGGR